MIWPVQRGVPRSPVSQENQELKAAKSYLLNMYDISGIRHKREPREVAGPRDGQFLGNWQPADAIVILVGIKPEMPLHADAQASYYRSQLCSN